MLQVLLLQACPKRRQVTSRVGCAPAPAADAALAAENDDPVEWSRASARKCIAKLVANGDIKTENDTKAEFIATVTPMDLDAAKHAVANGAPAVGVSLERAAKEFMAQEISDDDDDEQLNDPKADMHNDPKTTEIHRQLKPFYSAVEQKMLLDPLKTMTVHDYVEAVRENWRTYRGDVLHFLLGEDDMFFLVLSAEEYNGQTCLIIFELTANPDFDHLMLAITPVELADMCRSDPPEVNIYQEGSTFDRAYHPRGVPRRQAIKDYITCRRDIKKARDNGRLLPFFTRARGEGPYGRYNRIKHSSLLTCTQPRDMHNPEFKLAVRNLQLEDAYRNVVRAAWLLPAKNASEVFKWEHADRFKPRSEDELMDDGEQANQDFWRRALKPMRKVLAEFKDEVKDGKYKRDIEAHAEGCEISAPMISGDDDLVEIFKLGLNKYFSKHKGPLYYVEGKSIVEGRRVITGKDAWLTTERSYKTKLDGICSGMSKRKLKEYEQEQSGRYKDIAVASLREHEPAEGYGAIGMSVKHIDTHDGTVIDIKGDLTGHPVIPLQMDVDETVKVRLPADRTRNWNMRELQPTHGIQLMRSNDDEEHQILTIKASKKGHFEVELFYSHFVTAKSNPTITLSLMVRPIQVIDITTLDTPINIVVGKPVRLRTWCGSKEEYKVYFEPCTDANIKSKLKISPMDPVEGEVLLRGTQLFQMEALASGGPYHVSIFMREWASLPRMGKHYVDGDDEDARLCVTVLDDEDMCAKGGSAEVQSYHKLLESWRKSWESWQDKHGRGGSAKGGAKGGAKENGDQHKGDDGRSINDILNEHNQLDLRNNFPNWVYVSMMRNMQLEVLLPLHAEYGKIGCHWSTTKAESIEIVKQETHKEKDVEILTVKITDTTSKHWLAIVSNNHCDQTPDVIVEFGTYPPLPKPYTPKISASARVSIHLVRQCAPSYPTMYPATIKRGDFIVLRINARFVKGVVGEPIKGPDLHFVFGKDLNVTEEPWQLNDFAEDSWALGKFADGCVKQVTVTANDKLAAGTFPIMIYTIDPADDSDAEERPHAIVNLTVKHSGKDEAAATGDGASKKRKDEKRQSEVSAMSNQQLHSYATVLKRPNTYEKAMLQDLNDPRTHGKKKQSGPPGTAAPAGSGFFTNESGAFDAKLQAARLKLAAQKEEEKEEEK